MTVPSAKTWSSIPNWLPLSERPSEIRVTSGSASVIGLLIRGFGVTRGVIVDEPPGKVDGRVLRHGSPVNPRAGLTAGVAEEDPRFAFAVEERLELLPIRKRRP